MEEFAVFIEAMAASIDHEGVGNLEGSPPPAARASR
jgi:hypothetical protein